MVRGNPQPYLDDFTFLPSGREVQAVGDAATLFLVPATAGSSATLLQGGQTLVRTAGPRVAAQQFAGKSAVLRPGVNVRPITTSSGAV